MVDHCSKPARIFIGRITQAGSRGFLQFNKVDPDPLNRLVAAELERRWNEKLQDLNEVKERIEKERREVPKPSLEELQTIHSLSRRLPEVWRHPKTDPAVKKKIIRMVVQEVLMDLFTSRP